MDGLFTTLDNDWSQHLQRRSTRRRYETWAQEHPVFAAHPDLRALLAAARRQAHPELADQILAALAGRAGADDLAARALLQAVLPGLRALAITHHWAAPADELEAALVAIAWEHIRCYPITNRPRRIAANLLLDTGHHLRRTLPRRNQTTPLDTLGEHPAPDARAAAAELTELVCDAVAEGHLDPSPAALILRTRVLDEPVARVAADLGYEPDTIRHRRRRAEFILKVAG